MDNYANRDFYEDCFNTNLIVETQFYMKGNVDLLIETCVKSAIERLKKIKSFYMIEYDLLFSDEEMINYFKVKLSSAIIYYCLNFYSKKENVLKRKKEKITITDVNKLMSEVYVLDAINYLFGKETLSLFEESKRFGLDDKLMNNQNINLLDKDSRYFSFKNKKNIEYPIHIDNSNNWKERRKHKKISLVEYTCFMVDVRNHLICINDTNEVLTTLRNYFFESYTNLSLLSHISKKIKNIGFNYNDNSTEDNLQFEKVCDALVFITHIDLISSREKYIDYIIERKIRNTNIFQDICREVSYICDFALPFIVDYSFNLIKMIKNKNFIYKSVINIHIENKIESTPSIFFEEDILNKYIKRAEYKSYYCFDLAGFIISINNNLYGNEITFEMIITEIVNKWFNKSKYEILLEKKDVIEYFKNQIIFKDIIDNDERTNPNKTFTLLDKRLQLSEGERNNLYNRYMDYFHNNFINNYEFIHMLNESFVKEYKKAKRYRISQILLHIMNIEFLIKEYELENTVSGNGVKAKNIDDLYKKSLNIEEILEKYLNDKVFLTIQKKMIENEIERKYGIKILKYIFQQYNEKRLNKKLEDILSIYCIPEINSRYKYVDYYYKECMKSKEKRLQFLEEINNIDKEMFDIIHKNINIVLYNLEKSIFEKIKKKIVY